MATVYLAQDLKHKRKVALKVLKPELAAVLGADRFIQEIETTAALQHPNILPLFDSGEADGFLFYVMPFIDGETLRDKLNRETQLGIDEAVRITTEVAEALHYAHGQGVVHRDIKPENILLANGRPMVADFGIALALSAAAGGRMTETGMSLGTPHYMSPEQATADKEIGPRSDIYSLASVLFEMLTGEPPHTAGSAQAIIMKIIAETAVPVTKVRKSVPPNVAAALAKGLEKLPADRFESAKAFAEALANPAFTVATTVGSSSGLRQGSPAPWITYALAGLVVVLAGMVAILWPSPTASSFSAGVARFAIPDGADTGDGAERAQITRTLNTKIAFSPDGRRLVYAATRPGKPLALYEHRVDLGDDVILLESETEGYGLSVPVFSPDGAWLAFVRGSGSTRYLERVSTDRATSPIATMSGLGLLTGLSYGDDGTLVVATTTGLYRVPDTGGTLEQFAEVDSITMGATQWFQPHVLPRSRAVLVHAARSLQTEDADIMAFDLATGVPHLVLPNGMNPIYVPGGFLLFVREGTLMAVRFDPERAEVLGQPVEMINDVMQTLYMDNTTRETGAAQVAVSSGAGHLAYAAGGVASRRDDRIEEITPSGDTVPLSLPRSAWMRPRVSPDGSRLLVGSIRKWQMGIWVYDLGRGLPVQLKTGGKLDRGFAWNAAGDSVAFSSDRDEPNGSILYRMPADNSAPPERLGGPDVRGQVADWSSNGAIVYAVERDSSDIWVLSPDGQARPFVATPAPERWPAFSPDGRWIVYGSRENGREQVLVRPYPEGEPAILIAAGAAVEPSWSQDGLTIFYRQPNSLMAVDLPNGDPTLRGPPRRVGRWRGVVSSPFRSYDISPKGSMFRMSPDPRAVPQALGTSRIEVVLNFVEELKERFKE